MTDQPIVQPRMFVGFLLSTREFYNALYSKLYEYLYYIDLKNTVRQNVHNYFYSEALPSIHPMDTYLGGMVVYRVNQDTIDQSIRNHILSVMADMQWVIHDYISCGIQAILGQNVVRETEYYYNLDEQGRLMVYVPISQTVQYTFGISTLPEAAVVYSCYHFLPMEKKLAFSKAVNALNMNAGM